MDNNDGVMVALLPIMSDWANVDFPHLTLAYAGKASELSALDRDGMAKAALSIALLCPPVTMRILTKDVYGDGSDGNPKVDVVRFHPNSDLLKMREIVEEWDESKFTFHPHLTVGPEGTWNGILPMMVAFDRVCFCVGDQRQEFHLTSRPGGYYE